jgi:nitric oxide reductase subunit B
LTGEYFAWKGTLGNAWWWLGTQGWEYLELGRLWMYLLMGGMGIWLIHLWVEGMFEVFAVVVIGFLMVRLGLVAAHSALRALYF